MPRVPVYEGPSVRPTPLRTEQSIRAPEAAFGGATAQAFQQVGKDIGQVASLLDRRAEERGKEDAELAAWNAYTSASAEQQKLFYQGDNAIYNRRGGNALGSSNEAALELRRIGDETSKTLTSPHAQQQFQKLWARNQDSEMGAVSRHEAGQRREYADQTVAGAVANSTNAASLRFNDPGEVDNQMQIGELAIRANTKGLPPEQVNSQVTTFRSGVHKAVVLRMATDNPLAANEYYKSHADDFTADDNVALQRTLAPSVKRAEARTEADTIIKDVTRTQLTAPGTVHSAIESVESNGKQTAVSSAGNYGVMQINDVSGKEAADALGIPWDAAKARSDEGYNRQLGRKYFDIQMDKYGNRTLALAAYNAGGGKVDEWIKQFGDPRNGAISDAAWAAKIPFAETRQYVARVEGKIGAGSDNVDLTEAHRLNQERNGNDPEKMDAVDSDISKESNRREAARRDREQGALKTAFDHVNSGGSVSALSAEVVANLPVGRLADLEARERSLQRGKEPPENPTEYERLTMLASTDFAKFQAEKASDWEKVLPAAQVRHFVDLKFRIEQGDLKEAARGADLRKGLSIAKPLLTAANIDTTPKEGSDNAKRYAAFGTALLERMEAFKDKEQRKPTDAEVHAMAGELLLPGRLDINWGFDKDVRAFEITPDTGKQVYLPYKEIPADVKTSITLKLGERGKDEKLVEQIYAAVLRGDRDGMLKLLQPPAPAS
jgi:soluble lytic murein transglycosylase-like protein